MEQIEITKLKVHPFNTKMYDEFPNAEFIDSIKRYGIQRPILITKDNLIIGGQRRYKSAIHLKFKTVPFIVTEFIDELDIKEQIILDNLYRIEKVMSLRLSEGKMLEVIESERAKQNQKKAGGDKKSKEAKSLGAKKTQPKKRKPRTKDIVAKKTGVGSRTTYEGLQSIFDAAKEGDALAQTLMNEVDNHKKKPHAAIKKFKEVNHKITPDEKAEKDAKALRKKIKDICTHLDKGVEGVERIINGEIMSTDPLNKHTFNLIANIMRKAVRIGIESGLDIEQIKQTFQVTDIKSSFLNAEEVTYVE